MTARSPPLQVSLRIPLLAAAVVFLFVTAMNQMALRLHKAVAEVVANVTLAMLGKAKMVRIEKENTTIVDGAGETIWRRAGAILDLLSPAECANYLVNSGYASV